LPRLPYFLEKVSDTSFPRFPVFGETVKDNRQAKRGHQKLVNLVVPDKSEKFPGSQRNWDMEISIRKVQFGGQHTRKNTSSDRSISCFWGNIKGQI
jgi:hypothetical protein